MEETRMIHADLIHSGFGGLLLRNRKRSSDKSLRLQSSTSLRLRDSDRFTKQMTIFLSLGQPELLNST